MRTPTAAAGCLAVLLGSGLPASAALPAESSAAASGARQQAPRPSAITSWTDRPITLAAGRRFTDRVRVRPSGRRKLTITLVDPSSGRRVTTKAPVSRRGWATVRVSPPGIGRYRLRLRVSRNRNGAAARTRFRPVTVGTETGSLPRPTPAPMPPMPTPSPSPTAAPSPSPSSTAAPPPATPTSSPTPSPSPSDPSPDGVDAYVVADIGDCNGAPAATAALIPAGAAVIVPGDLAYPTGSRANFDACYLPHYGRFLATTFPVPGNHEYYAPDLAYFDVFGTRVGTRADPWYETRLGDWRVLMLNSTCGAVGGCDTRSPQYRWLAQYLADNRDRCLAAVWHAPRWSSGPHGGDPAMGPMYALLEQAGADLILAGHDHAYERFARLTAAGAPSATGPRQFVVGTGGAQLYGFGTPVPGSQVRFNGQHGVLRLRLASDGYAWQFLGIDGATVDEGSDTC